VSAFTLRPGTAADAAAVLALNNASVPHVNALTADTLAQIVAMSAQYTVAEDAEGILGFVLCIESGRSYWSDNYNWFGERYDAFLYLDRVAVAARAQRRGVGRAIYEGVHAAAQGHWPRVALEVNFRPPNPVSVAFHAAMGYAEVGRREYNDGANAVQMFIKEIG
jgi:predicted GNAT superfamily acetyltransferase